MTINVLAPSTELSAAPPWFLLAGGQDYVLCSPKPVPEQLLLQYRGLTPLQAWVARSGRGSRRQLWAPGFTPLSGVAVMFGIRADRAAAVPEGSWRRFGGPRFPIDGELRSADWMAAQLARVPSRRELAHAQVAEVRHTYGKLLCDISYRITNSALFDPAVPTTRRFDQAMVLWSQLSANSPEAEVTRRAGMVKLTFDAARAHAETLGFDHLPNTAQEPARRASKAARLAYGSSSPHERDLAIELVVRILSSLALHYLPAPVEASRALGR